MRRGPPLKAEPATQLRLLELQAVDARLDRLAHRRATLPEQAEVERLVAEGRALDADLAEAEAAVTDSAREQRKAESDVEQVVTRRERDQRRLDAGSVGSPRELESLQHELASLAARQDALEEIQLAVMERVEAAEKRLAELTDRRREQAAALEVAERARDAAYAEIDAERARADAERADLASRLDPDLVALYERLRAQYAGVGAAALRQRRCEGCRMELNASDLARIAAAPADEVLRCEECRRILVRTPESGL